MNKIKILSLLTASLHMGYAADDALGKAGARILNTMNRANEARSLSLVMDVSEIVAQMGIVLHQERESPDLHAVSWDAVCEKRDELVRIIEAMPNNSQKIGAIEETLTFVHRLDDPINFFASVLLLKGALFLTDCGLRDARISEIFESVEVKRIAWVEKKHTELSAETDKGLSIDATGFARELGKTIIRKAQRERALIAYLESEFPSYR